MPERSRRFYRIVSGPNVTLDDVRSNEARGFVPRRPLSRLATELWSGLSVFDSLEAAQAHGSRSTWLGPYVAEIVIPAAASYRAARTTGTVGHWTLWADPNLLLGHIAGIFFVANDEENVDNG